MVGCEVGQASLKWHVSAVGQGLPVGSSKAGQGQVRSGHREDGAAGLAFPSPRELHSECDNDGKERKDVPFVFVQRSQEQQRHGKTLKRCH